MTDERYADLLARWGDRSKIALIERQTGRVAAHLNIQRAEARELYRRWREENCATRHGSRNPRPPQRERPAPASAPEHDEHDERAAVEMQALKDELARVRRLLRDQRRDDALEEQVRRIAFGLAEARMTPPKWVSAPDRIAGSAGVPTLFLSDLHWGETVRAEEVYGVNEYSMDVAARRLRRVTETTVELLRDTIVSSKGYPGVVLALGGDMISGALHEDIAATDEATPAECVVDLCEHLCATIRVLADEFGRVFVPCVTGNHSRTTRKPWAKRRVATSWEWMLYLMCERAFVGDDRVRFAVTPDTDVLYTVAGTRYNLTHGDSLGVRGGDGIIGALGPIMRGRHKVSSASVGLGREHDVLIMGHWHQLLALRNVIVNGSLKGYDEFARAHRFSYEPAAQALWLTHPRHGVTVSMPVFAADPPAAAADAWDWAS